MTSVAAAMALLGQSGVGGRSNPLLVGTALTANGWTGSCLVQIDGADSSITAICNPGARILAGDRLLLIGRASSVYVLADMTTVQTPQSYYGEWSLSAQSMASGIGTFLVNLTTIKEINDIAANSPMVTSTGTWTCPVSGVYTFTIGVKYTTFVGSSRMAFWIARNGTAQDDRIYMYDASSTSASTMWAGSVTRWINQGDVLTFAVDQFTGASQTIDTAADICAISIKKEIP